MVFGYSDVSQPFTVTKRETSEADYRIGNKIIVLPSVWAFYQFGFFLVE
jgi:hypothetical protein